MAARSRVKDLQEAVICSVCLASFNDPVILIKCGHNFCRSCITQYCQESRTSPPYPCPQCRAPFQAGEFQPNRELRNVVEIAKNIPEPKGKKVCETHEALLQLFCEVDQTPICVVCRESRSHRDHPVLPIEEAAQDYQANIRPKTKSRCDEEKENFLKPSKTKAYKPVGRSNSPLAAKEPDAPNCPDGWVGYLGKCYYFSATEGNWTYCQNHCSSLNASLAVTDTFQDLVRDADSL
ncbi:hypothetical protein KIL84_004603 [Mauremys mutica]|uniref:RING-type E3 ubiquitin transferase n=1 Tax=Mauremys mutica TaxID=74926 RepID=A0A9D3XPB2_9SAUR|nr:hypothetical protein KIL84_004603 [Mauremys mutica]